MAKKRSGGTPKESVKKKRARAKVKRHRYGQRTLVELRAYHKVLRGEAARLEQFCEQLAETEAQNVSFDGINRIDDGVEIIYGFVDGVEMAARKEARARRKPSADG